MPCSRASFPTDWPKARGFVCLCYLTAPSAAKYAYLERRLPARLPEAQDHRACLEGQRGRARLIKPEHALALLPGGTWRRLQKDVQNNTRTLGCKSLNQNEVFLISGNLAGRARRSS